MSGARDPITDHLADHNNPHQVTAAQIDAVTHTELAKILADYAKINDVVAKLLTYTPMLTFIQHVADHANPHHVTVQETGGISIQTGDARYVLKGRPLTVPQNITAHGAVKDHEFAVQWASVVGVDPSKGSNGYTVTLTPAGPAVSAVDVTSPATPFVTVTGAAPGTTYTVHVVAKGDGTDRTDSGEGTATITTSMTKPAAPAAPRLAGVTATPNMVELKWDAYPHPDTITALRWECDGQGNGWPIKETVAKDATGATCKPLTAFRSGKVSFALYAVNGILDSESSPVLTIVFPETPSKPVATSTGPGEATVTWTSGKKDTTGYDIERRKDGGSWTTVQHATKDTISFKNSDLPAGDYYYRITALNGDSTMVWSLQSDKVTVTPGRTPTPEMPVVKDGTVTRSAFTVDWAKVSGTSYAAWAMRSDGVGSKIQGQVSVEHAKAEAAFTGLEVATAYDVTLTATASGMSPSLPVVAKNISTAPAG